MAVAACVSDMHICPMWSGPTPHVGGPITTIGARTVMLGGRPAAIVGDLAICATGPPAQIIKGSATVMINGQPAARLGDMTSHGGAISGSGCPTVDIGG